MFKRISSAFSSLYSSFSSTINSIFLSGKLDEQNLKKIEKILLESDTGINTTQKIIKNLKLSLQTDPQTALSQTLGDLLSQAIFTHENPIIIFVGINGGGKTTSAAKLAHLFKQQHQKVLMAAADTFRAAAVDQLKLWAERLQIPVVTGLTNQDPSSVVYQACTEFKKGNYDKLIIDTAGRLQTKTHLMKELEKIHRTISKQLPETAVTTLLIIDSMLGQNSLEQAKLFNESTKIDGIILTKTDGTGKGGISFSIIDTLKIPIAYVTFGEHLEDIAPFNTKDFVFKILNNH
ncbi:MAG: signal recognition particle-docking protein FtsY [Candidatus Babeliaceae bacterium]|nr:signal recognition particle-docking protein FtsY [Candidatus Babeliaceae bacterium]